VACSATFHSSLFTNHFLPRPGSRHPELPGPGGGEWHELHGHGQFKFALVDGSGAATYWSNGVSSVGVSVTRGLYSVQLGDTGIPNMETAVPAVTFTNSDVRLRVWFDGGAGLQLLAPDQRITSAGYALMSANVTDGSVTSAKLAAGAVTTPAIANGT